MYSKMDKSNTGECNYYKVKFFSHISKLPNKAMNIDTKSIIYHLNDKEFVENILSITPM